MLCADLAAGNLHRALETNALSARSLANYERDWKSKIGRELKMGYWLRRFYEHLSDKQIDKIFDIMIDNDVIDTLLKADDLSFDWHGEAMAKLMGRGAIAKVIKVMGLPYLLFK